MRRSSHLPISPALASRLSRAANFADGGCFFADPPAMSGASARVIWDPIQFTQLTRLVALEAGSVPGATLFRASDMAVASLTVHHAGMQILLMTKSELSLQLNIHGASLAAPVHLFADVVSMPPKRSERAATLAALNDLHMSGGFRSGRFPPEPRGARLRMILQALDGSLAGVSHRDIATEIFGSDRVAEAWRDPRSHLRDAIRRAVSRGRMLMLGGYRQFVSSA